MTNPIKLGTSVVVASAFVVCCVCEGVAQNEQAGAQAVRPFQSFFSDAMITGIPYWGGGLSAREFDIGSALQLDGFGGYTVNSRVEIQGHLGLVRVNPGEGSSTSGFTDLLVAGHYVFNDVGEVAALAAGGYVELPVGKRSVGGNTLDFGLFGAVRHLVDDRTTLTGTVGLDFLETTDFRLSLIGFCDPFYFGYCATPLFELTRKASLSIGGGAVYAANEDLHLVGEFRVETLFDYAALSGGLDYGASFGHFRGVLAVGLDDGAPDLALTVQVLRSWR